MRYRFKIITMLFFLSQLPKVSFGMTVQEIKNELVATATTFQGTGDPDFTQQRTLEVLVQRLLTLAPQPPVKERLHYIEGAWKQVWGPYDYRNDKRGVDPELGTDEIYQVVSQKGYYYNVSPLYKKGDRSKERIGLLRGEFKIDEENANVLRVKFTRYPGLSARPQSINLWDLAPLAEAGELEDRITIVPTIIVKFFFEGGSLEEVYTDHDLRILYGFNKNNFAKKAIYIMTRVE